jgi:hypothetical protein
MLGLLPAPRNKSRRIEAIARRETLGGAGSGEAAAICVPVDRTMFRFTDDWLNDGGDRVGHVVPLRARE